MTKKKNIQPTKNAEKEIKNKPENFKISIKLGNFILSGEGKTALEALQSIPVPLKITTKGILTISQGKKKKELVYTVPRLKRLFYPSAQPIISKGLGLFLK